MPVPWLGRCLLFLVEPALVLVQFVPKLFPSFGDRELLIGRGGRADHWLVLGFFVDANLHLSRVKLVDLDLRRLKLSAKICLSISVPPRVPFCLSRP